MILFTTFTCGELVEGFRESSTVGISRLVMNILYGISFVLSALNDVGKSMGIAR